MKKGHFIVIEGTDGSGKGTQVELLQKKLKSLKVPIMVIDFPRYEGNVYGEVVGNYLKGQYGGLEDVSPYLASLAYAGDRMLAKPVIEKWLKSGKVVIANRYTPSNKAHMAAKLKNSERVSFIKWLDNLEYKVNGIPKEELVILLYVPANLGQQNVDQKATRNYIKGEKRDIHEKSLDHLKTSGQIYLQLAKQEPNWQVVECSENGQMKSREEIHQQILEILKERGIIKK